MAKSIKSINLLPEFFRTDKNSKFLSSTIDQLIQPPQLERISGYIGSTATTTYNAATDVYITETTELRKNYQLDPALIINDTSGNITKAVGIDDLTNEISVQGGLVDNFDRIYRTKFYSYDPRIDWDKFVNFQNYFWLITGPSAITVGNVNVELDIIGSTSYTLSSGILLSNGMKIKFDNTVSPAVYQEREFFVEGVGVSIKLVDYSVLTSNQIIATEYNDGFDTNPFDEYPFDNFKKLPLTPEYITINRASQDSNPWSRYNRWVHRDIITLSAQANGVTPFYPDAYKASRPIIEFQPDLKLYNFGSVGIAPVSFIDTVTTDVFKTVEGAIWFYIDGVKVQDGSRIIFNADPDPLVNGKIFQVKFINVDGEYRITLTQPADYEPFSGASTIVGLGNTIGGTSWWYNGTMWIMGQQHNKLNQGPLFDLFDSQGNSYSDTLYYNSTFAGTPVFGYKIGTGTADSVLGFPLTYKNTGLVGSYLFENYFATDTFSIISNNITDTVSINQGFLKLLSNDTFINIWQLSAAYPIPENDGVYDSPLGLTNNPLNGNISSFTLSELSDHLSTMLERDSDYTGDNLRDIANPSQYGTRLISNFNPIVFSQFFIGDKENNVIDALHRAADQYNEFKMSFLQKLSEFDNQSAVVETVDSIITSFNANKSQQFPWSLSDMLAYGQDKITRTWTVTSPSNTIYPITTEFNPSVLSLRSVLVYINGIQQILGTDYVFLTADAGVEFLTPLAFNDVIVIEDYTSTAGCYIPPTPSKLGLYPKFRPEIYIDNTYASGPQKVIKGHDGSITVAFDDYRDAIILELEKRIYNNIKAEYKYSLFDVAQIMPGAFRTVDYSIEEINQILQADFIRWTGTMGVDGTVNSTFDSANYLTWNYTGGYNNEFGIDLKGSWRNIYKYLYDTDTPNLTPWEMLGFSEMPDWWTSIYGEAPYTSFNIVLWQDLEQGRIQQGPRTGIDVFYARPGLSNIIPVTSDGTLRNPIYLASNVTPSTVSQNWTFGDIGPTENAWRRSSYYPFAIQRLLALTKPASYSAVMYDPSRMILNAAGQWVYGQENSFLNIKNIVVPLDVSTLTSGYSVYVCEIGKQRINTYIQNLIDKLTYLDVRLFYKVGGFVSKNKIQVIIDAYNPTSIIPGAILPPEDYNLILNVSNPIQSTPISGIIVQKSNGVFVVKGYDSQQPYFNVYLPVRNISTPAITIGGISESYVTWAPGTSTFSTPLNSIDITTANSAATGIFYQQGQIVLYNGVFYRVKVSHSAESTFDSTLYVKLPSLPITGGVTVNSVIQYSPNISQIPYGAEFDTQQQVYDFIKGYGQWLETQGFIFDNFDSNLNSILDWDLSAREFLYWTTQNWADNSVITLSPFSDQIKFTLPNTVVDNIFDSFYEYSLLQVNGKPFPQQELSVNRQDGICTISTKNNTPNSIYFARLNSVQKEHVMVFNNVTMFNDIIFDIQAGYRQKRMKLIGFRTANWNGDYFSPGFIYDTAQIYTWQSYKDFQYGDVVQFNGNYYSAKSNITGTQSFNISDGWILLGSKPVADLLPNFDYKINQFEDFYSLDIDNFDVGQEKMAQHLTGYTPRTYLNNIFTDPIAQYKFYQGYIREKGTRNAITKLAKASVYNLQGQLDFYEEWAFRVGNYGSYSTYQEIEISLVEGTFIENPQIINVVDTVPSDKNELVYYSLTQDLAIAPAGFDAATMFTVNQDDFKLSTAGYTRIDDVNYTAYNTTDLLSIAANQNLNDGNTVWLGFTDSGDWDVLRYEKNTAGVVGVYVSSPATSITFTTDTFHNLSVGSVVYVTQFNSQVDGVYKVIEVPSLNEFSVSSSLTYINNAVLASPGLLFEFVSTRFVTFDTALSDPVFLKFPYGTKLWIDNNGTGQWTVYEKINNYTSTSTSVSGIHQLGKYLVKNPGDNIVIASDPIQGALSVYQDTQDGLEFKFQYAPVGVTTSTDFGRGLAYGNIEYQQTNHGLVFVGLPGINTQTGQVNVISINSSTTVGTLQYTILSNVPTTHEQFGSSIYASGNLLLVGALGTNDRGSVHVYTVDASSSTVNITTGTVITPPVSVSTGSQWGYTIKGSNNAEVIAVGSYNAGYVAIYTATNFSSPSQIISGSDIHFGKSLAVSYSGDYLFIGSPDVRNIDQSYGKVDVYYRTSVNNTYTHYSTITNPVPGAGMKFGSAVDINTVSNTLVVTAIGTNLLITDSFDKGSVDFDSSSTYFYDNLANAGTAYVYVKKSNNGQFRLADQVTDGTANSYFGRSLVVDESIYVGAPAGNGITNASIYRFDKIDPTADSWYTLRQQDTLVSVDQIRKVSLIDTFADQVVDYLDVIDPLKGKIAGPAEEEIAYKSYFDPATYSTGTSTVIVDADTNWLDKQVGSLWWDLSTIKYVWYEQGDLAFRKNQWGNLFPGSSVDIYEWVGTEYLPSEWAILADTAAGLTQGVSGQPKYPDDSVVSIAEIYNPITNAFTNKYYYWVKNKVLVPNVKNRRLDAAQVASLIEDPTGYGYMYASLISNNAVILANVAGNLIDSRIHLNVCTDVINSQIEKHTEWLLLQEGVATSTPTTLLDKKLFDSLIGQDTVGNLVPDPTLSSRNAYGVEIRPRQSMFVNQAEALRNLIEFANTVFNENQITGNYSFANLNAQDSYTSYNYDQTVEDYESLSLIDTSKFVQAEISCTIVNGRIDLVTINNPGYGYKTVPTVQVSGMSRIPASVSVTLDSNGSINNVVINNAGTGYVTVPMLSIRPYTVIVLVDPNHNNSWAEYQWTSEKWNFVRVSSYNTAEYWSYADWSSTDYNPHKDNAYVFSETYQLDFTYNIVPGQYVKIQNSGDGNYIILEKVDADVVGNFNSTYNLVYKQNGTIQLSTGIIPVTELRYILTALKNDLFINDLKAQWNLFFFAAVRYALSEQKMLDWAFKTSFINVVNNAGELNQPPVYKLQDSTYFENYLAEVKPYHTQVRGYTTNYTVTDPTNSHFTDFDRPAVFNTLTQTYGSVDIGNPLLDSYPWKDWADNYTYEVGSIIVTNPGTNYTSPPTVIITAQSGDTGSGASAVAYVTAGKISQIVVTDPGSGYTKAPTVEIITPLIPGLLAASAYAELYNGKVRTNTIGVKFDRYSRQNEIGLLPVQDSFYCNGINVEFVLTWVANTDPATISVSVDGNYVVSSDYQIIYYTDTINGYRKKYSKLSFINYIPPAGKIVKITYAKNIELLSAIERLENYYAPDSGMPGNTATQVMSGLEFPGTVIESLPFDYNINWGYNWTQDNRRGTTSTVSNYGFGGFAEDIGYYTSTVSTSPSSSIGGTWTTFTVENISGVNVGQHVNVINGSTAYFNSNAVSVISIDIGTQAITVNTSTLLTIPMASVVEFWSVDLNATILDTSLDGGEILPGQLISAQGINPEERIIDAGNGFISVDYSYAPEELVPGHTSDSLALNVYTISSEGSPAITSNYFEVMANTSTINYNTIVAIPTSIASMRVVANRQLLMYTATITTQMVDQPYYSMDWANNRVIIPPQSKETIVGYTIMGKGGSRNLDKVGLIDNEVSTVYNVTNGSVASLSGIISINTASVHVNGMWIGRRPLGFHVTNSVSDMYYELGGDNDPTGATTQTGQATVFVYNLNPTTSSTINSWFFGTTIQKFNELREQYSTVTNATSLTLLYSPPVVDNDTTATQVIVEVNTGTGYKIITPPAGTYAGDYTVYGSTLTFNSPITGNVRVVSYIDPTGALINPQVFTNNVTPRRVTLSAPIVDDEYMWVILNGIPLIRDIEYVMLEDQQTVQISETLNVSSTDIIEVIVFVKNTNKVLGYRIFNDMLGRTAFKRLSKKNTTYLTATLYSTSTSIQVADPTVLSPAIPSKNIPGVIIIDGERIEFLKIVGNSLTNLRRGTLGTGPKDVCAVNTRVIDQGYLQSIPYSDNVFNQTIFVNTTTNNYIINKSAFVTATSFGTPSAVSDGITLQYSPVLPSVALNPTDELAIYYGGRLLRKDPIVVFDTTQSFDSPEYINTLTIVNSLPASTDVGIAYIVSATNQVWVQENSNSTDSVNGFVYRGLNYVPAEYSITVDQNTQTLSLNIVGGIENDVKLTMVKQEVNVAQQWVDPTVSVSLFDSASIAARFIQESPAELPTNHYYGES